MSSTGKMSDRGSEWHRWDPHIHAPGTAREDYFAGDWDGYLKKINEADPPIRALGVTDYLCIQTYREVCARKAAGHLPKVDLIFPNVEMRLDTRTTHGRGINLHLLFSPNDPEHESEIERILSSFRFESTDREYACTRTDLLHLARMMNPRQTDERAAFAEGVNLFKVSMDQLRSVFRKEQWLRENCLVAVQASQNDGTSGLQHDDAFAAVRLGIERFAHIIFSGNPRDRDFWLGLKRLDQKAVEQKYGFLKPCLHGCDAHRLEEVGAPDHKRYCWIKGDLCFESLRQAVIEPGERVRISECSPVDSADSVTISDVRPISTPWLKNNIVRLNRGLVSVVGARGSGKTALVDLIAAGAKALGPNLGESSFLRRATDPIDLIGNASVEHTWGDGEKTTEPFTPRDPNDDATPGVRYLSQHFVNQLCSSSGLAVELRREIERVIFEQIDRADRYDTDSFDALAALLLDPVRDRREQWMARIQAYSEKIAEETRLRDRLPKLRTDRTTLVQQLAKDRKDLQGLLPKDKAKHNERWLAVDAACTVVENQLETIRRREKALGDLLTETAFIQKETHPQRLADLQEQFSDSKLTDAEWKVFHEKFTGDVAATIANAKQPVLRSIDILLNGDAANPVNLAEVPFTEWPMAALRNERERVRKLLGIDAAQQRKYDALKATIATKDANLKRLEGTLEKGDGVDARLRTLKADRSNAYRQLFGTFAEEERVLKTLYGPIQQQFEGATGTLSKLRFAVKRQVQLDKWITKGEQLLDLRKESVFRGQGRLGAIAQEELLADWLQGTDEAVAHKMHDFIGKYFGDIMKAQPTFAEPVERTEWLREIADWIFGTDHIDIHYAVEYEGVAVEQLSPGTRGIVLLLLYLVVDRDDRRPLLIDQPEENLDPKSVFDDLVPHFRDARHRRQVIIVTHNANLVVNTDADQVIVATSVAAQPGALPEISYQSGSLENPSIRRAVCEILEGGERAFLERERRYRLQWQHILAEPEQTISVAAQMA